MRLIFINCIFRRSDIFLKFYFRGIREKEIIKTFWYSTGVWYSLIIVLKDDTASILKFLVWHKRWDSAPKPLVMFFTVSGNVVSQRLFSDTNYQISMVRVFQKKLISQTLKFIPRHITSKLCFPEFCVHVGNRSYFHDFVFDRSIRIDNISNQRIIKPCSVIDIIKYVCHVEWGRGNIIQIFIFTEIFLTSIVNFLRFCGRGRAVLWLRRLNCGDHASQNVHL